MNAEATGTSRRGRPPSAAIGLTETLTVKLHPDHMAFLGAEATRTYTTIPEVARRIITAAMRARPPASSEPNQEGSST